jgi:DNA-binding transcriptional LysR family regulator
MELRDLRFFVALAEELHFGRAAKRMFIAQPPFSQQIRRFETELGVTLFERTSRKVELTAAGQRLLPPARQALAAMNEFTSAAVRSSEGRSGRLRIGVETSVLLDSIPEALRNYRTQYPDVDLVMTSMPVETQVEQLLDDMLDVAISWTFEGRSGIASKGLPPVDMVVVLPTNHHLASGPESPLELQQLRHETFLASHGETAGYLKAICELAGFEPHIETRSTDTFSAIAMAGAGAGIVIASAGMTQLHIESVVYRPLLMRTDPVTHSLLWRSTTDSPLTARFVSCIDEFLRT